MRFPFNERKAAQAAALLVSRRGGEHNYGCLLKLLFLADRRALIEDGMPITGDDMWLLEKGPILENVKNCMNGYKSAGNEWRKYVTQRDDENRVFVVGEGSQFDELSDREIEILEMIDQEHGSKTWDEIVEFCHATLPEWETIRRGARKILLPEKILFVEHVPQDRVDEIAAHAALLMRSIEIGGSGL